MRSWNGSRCRFERGRRAARSVGPAMQYALCASLDDLVLTTPWGAHGPPGRGARWCHSPPGPRSGPDASSPCCGSGRGEDRPVPPRAGADVRLPVARRDGGLPQPRTAQGRWYSASASRPATPSLPVAPAAAAVGRAIGRAWTQPFAARTPTPARLGRRLQRRACRRRWRHSYVGLSVAAERPVGRAVRPHAGRPACRTCRR